MSRCLRSGLSLVLLIAVSGCCGFLGGPAQTKLMVAPAASFDNGGSDVGLLLAAGCPCPAVAGLLWGAGGGYFNSDFQDYFFGRMWGAYALSTGDAVTPFLFASVLAKRHRDYNNSGNSLGGGASLFQESDGSGTDLGISFGVQVDYEGLEQVTPFARLERLQVSGGGFQMASIGLGFNVGN